MPRPIRLPGLIFPARLASTACISRHPWRTRHTARPAQCEAYRSASASGLIWVPGRRRTSVPRVLAYVGRATLFIGFAASHHGSFRGKHPATATTGFDCASLFCPGVIRSSRSFARIPRNAAFLDQIRPDEYVPTRRFGLATFRARPFCSSRGSPADSSTPTPPRGPSAPDDPSPSRLDRHVRRFSSTPPEHCCLADDRVLFPCSRVQLTTRRAAARLTLLSTPVSHDSRRAFGDRRR